MTRIVRYVAQGLALAGLAWAGCGQALNAFPPLSFQRHIAACISCHGEDGRGGGGGAKLYPRLAGQPASYLAAQLRAFQRGQRSNDTMYRMVKGLPASYLWDMARYFASQQAPYPPVRMNSITVAELKRGERLVKQGRWHSGMPTCATCHGEDLGGRPPAVPLLAGQYEAYLAEQLTAWRAGERRNDPGSMMRWIANGLTDRDIADIAAYLASLRPSNQKKVGLSLRHRAPKSAQAHAGSGDKSAE